MSLCCGPSRGVLTASAEVYREAVAEACRERLSDGERAWAMVESIPQLASLPYERREQLRTTIFAAAVADTSTCDRGVLRARFRAAVDREYTTRLMQARENMRATYGERWDREMWVASRVIATLGYDGEQEELRTQYEEQYDVRANALEDFLRTMEERDATHGREMEAALAEREGTLARLTAELEGARSTGNLELQKVIEQARWEYLGTWEEAAAKRFESSQATRRLLGDARISAASGEKIAAITTDHEYRTSELDAERDERLATLQASVDIALSEDDVEEAAIRRRLERERALIDERKAVRVAEIEAAR